MSNRRFKVHASEGEFFYLITNRITARSRLIDAVAKKKLKDFIFDAERKFACHINEYVILDNHYHFIISIPQIDQMSEEELREKYDSHYNAVSNPSKEQLADFRAKVHDLSYIVGNIEQRFAQWYNRSTRREGHLWGRRFDSSLIESNLSLLRCSLYIIMNPVRAKICLDPKDYQYSSYAERLAGKEFLGDGNMIDILMNILTEGKGYESQEVDNKRREYLRFLRFALGEKAVFKDSEGTLAEALYKVGRKMHLTWLDECQHKLNFLVKGLIVGSSGFVEEMKVKLQDKFHQKRDVKATVYDESNDTAFLRRFRS